MIKAVLTSILRHRIALAAITFIGLGWGGFEAAIRSDWFLDTVHHRAIAKLEQSLGKTVSIDEIRLGDSRLAFEIKGLELRASDGAAAAPLLSVPHVAATLGWRSLLGGVTVLESLSLRDPVLNMTVAEGGPAILSQASQESLISGLAVRRFELDGGQLVWNGRPYDLEFRGTGLRVETRFDPSSQRHTIDAELRDPQVGSAGSLALIGSIVSVSAVADTTGVEITSAEIHGQDLSAQLRGTIQGRQQFSARCVFSLRSTIAPLAGLAGYSELGLLGSLAASGELEWDGSTDAVLYSGGFAASSVGSAALGLDLSVAGRFFGKRVIRRTGRSRGCRARRRLAGPGHDQGPLARAPAHFQRQYQQHRARKDRSRDGIDRASVERFGRRRVRPVRNSPARPAGKRETAGRTNRGALHAASRRGRVIALQQRDRTRRSRWILAQHAQHASQRQRQFRGCRRRRAGGRG